MTNNKIESIKEQSKSEQEIIKKRKLILHFDQHNTIQVACTLPGREITVKDGLNNFLTSTTWGKEVNNKWMWVCDEPLLKKPKEYKNDVKVTTYYKYLERLIVKKPEDRVELRKRTSKFVYEEHGKKFQKFFDMYIKSLKYGDLKQNTTQLPVNTIRGDDDNSLYHYIFPEFFDLIRRLQKGKREFAIILRTMGIDSRSFLDTIIPVLEGKHRDFNDIQNMNINTHVGCIRRTDDNEIEFEIDGNIYSNENEIYEKLNSIEGILAIRDDFAYWQKNNYNCYSAKPIWLNLNDSKHQHIIFDDNIRLEALDDCIVNLRIFNQKNFYNIDFNAYELFQHSTIIQPDLFELLNKPSNKDFYAKNYYYDKINVAERKYDYILSKFQNDNLPLIKNGLICNKKLTRLNSHDLEIFTNKKLICKILNDPSIDDSASEIDKLKIKKIKSKNVSSFTCCIL
jgi:hypothetical protein